MTVFSATLPLELELELELLLALPTFSNPPATPPGGDVDVVAFFAKAVNAVSVFPVAGALIAATMPAWQWFPVVWPQ